MEEKRSPEGTRGGHNPPGCGWQARSALVCCAHPYIFFSVYLLYHVPPLFDDSGVFRKDSLMCSSGVIFWIILLSTSMGVPEI